MRLSRLNIILYVGLVFASGVLVGVFGQKLLNVKTVVAKANRNPDEWRKHYMTEMTSRLKLRTEQVGQLDKILDETRSKFHEVHEKYRPEMDAIRNQQQGKINAMLDESQRGEYEKMRAERERKTPKGSPGPGL